MPFNSCARSGSVFRGAPASGTTHPASRTRHCPLARQHPEPDASSFEPVHERLNTQLGRRTMSKVWRSSTRFGTSTFCSRRWSGYRAPHRRGVLCVTWPSARYRDFGAQFLRPRRPLPRRQIGSRGWLAEWPQSFCVKCHSRLWPCRLPFRMQLSRFTSGLECSGSKNRCLPKARS